MKNQWPIAEYLQEQRYELPRCRFATPAHGNGPRRATFDLGITGLEEADRAYIPKAVFRNSERHASSVFDSLHTFYFPSGASYAVMAAVFATFRPNARIAVTRNIHRSVVAALTLLGAQVTWVMPKGNWFSYTCEDLERALGNGESVDGVVVSSPSYEGDVSDVRAIADYCQEASIGLVVDESLGSHWVCSSVFPKSSLYEAADVVIHSLHKRVGSLVPGALLHLPPKSRLDLSHVTSVVEMFRSTSASNPVLLDMEYTIRNLRVRSHSLKDLVSACDYVAEVLRSFQACEGRARDRNRCDPFVIHFLPDGVDSVKFADLIYDSGFDYEYAGFRGISWFVSPESRVDDVRALGFSVRENLERLQRTPQGFLQYQPPKIVIPLAEAVRTEAVETTIGMAVGRIAAETVASCPPGVPIVVPGEEICSWHSEFYPNKTVRVVK